MLDYHLHLWPHEESSVWFKLDQIADYCDEAAAHGVTELALTEHTSRFVDVVSAVDFSGETRVAVAGVGLCRRTGRGWAETGRQRQRQRQQQQQQQLVHDF